jgi:hypothetical protein
MRLGVQPEHANALRLLRINRIRKVQRPLTIEGHALNEEKITAILDGKCTAGETTHEVLRVELVPVDRKSFRERYLRPTLDSGRIGMMRPDKPNSRPQFFFLTPLSEQSRIELS